MTLDEVREVVQTLNENAVIETTMGDVKAIVTVNITIAGALSHVGINRGLDNITDLLGKTFFLELISAELDPSK
ncbi:hypothetical protein QJS10_CPA06g01742 [Acorus calamus]|uniref:Uncharacterized protein n=1 Tax=Acorus calamus TaxID=4465 RepID=A0AAV9EKW5_ACOCL|nr:hypothetical protein QJS10_CPA06g01742 [Acorus calamus]